MNVLVIDDDDDSRKIYGMALEYAGHRVMTAHDGAEGVRVARREEPDVILLDIAMPIVDGFTALRQLRALPATRDLPILALTARASQHDVSELLAVGFDELLLKPVEPAEVVSAVNRWLEHPRSGHR